MAVLDSILGKAMSERGAKAFVPSAIFALALSVFLYGFRHVRIAANNLFIDSLILGVSFVSILVGDKMLNHQFIETLDFEKLLASWKDELAVAHEILSKDRNALGDVRDLDNKARIVARFFPAVTLRVVGFYAAALSLVFALNVILSSSAAGAFLSISGGSRIGLTAFLIVISLATGALVNSVEASAPEKKEGDKTEIVRQLLSSYFVDNLAVESQSSGPLLRAIGPLVAIPMFVKARPLAVMNELFDHDNLTSVLDDAMNEQVIIPINPEGFNLLKATDMAGHVKVMDNGHTRLVPLPDLSKLGPDRLINAVFSGMNNRGTACCRFRVRESKGILTVTAFRVCIIRLREVQLTINKTYFREDPNPTTVFSVFGIGDKDTLTDIQLKIELKVTKPNQSDFGTCP